MANPSTAKTVRLHLESLEGRDIPSASPWNLETFENTAIGHVPVGWVQNVDGSEQFATSTALGLGSRTSLVSSNDSTTEARAWIAMPFNADVQTSSAVYIGSQVPAMIFTRGQNLDSDTPSYYSASIANGGSVRLLRVVDGEMTVLDTVQPDETLNAEWVQLSLRTVSNSIEVTVFRTDAAQYLADDGSWQATPTAAITTTDTAISADGFVGLARPTGFAGDVIYDNFHASEDVSTPSPDALHTQNFDHDTQKVLPDGWKQWSNNTSESFQMTDTRTLVGAGSLSVNSLSSGIARAWFDSTLPADVQVSTGVYLDSLIPASLFARGRDLDTATPSYYAVSVTRGLNLQLLSVVDGQTTVLSELGTEGWQTEQWVQVSLGLQSDHLYVQVYRPDTAQYLNSAGSWQALPSWAMEVTDSAITQAGRAGVARDSSYAGELTFDNFFVTTAAGTTSRPVDRFSFDAEQRGSRPDGWAHWSTSPKGGFQISAVSATSPTNLLASNGTADISARLWLQRQYPANSEIDSNVFITGASPAELLIRGQNLNTTQATYYSATVTREMNVQLNRVVNGQSTVIGSVQAVDGAIDQWLQVRFGADGDQLSVTIQRTDTGEYLTSDGTWQSDDTSAIDVTDGAITQAGYAGLNRVGGLGRVLYDDIVVSYSDTPTTPPPPPTLPPTPPIPPVPPIPPLPPVPPVVTPSTGLPDVTRHYSHIRIAQLAYSGTPFTSFEQGLLRDSVDIVIANVQYLDQIDQLNPETSQLIYTNVSNIYLELLTDWLHYADAHDVDREDGFYHVTEATAFSGASASSQPVNQFWSVQRGRGDEWKNLTRHAKANNGESVTFAERGESVAVGYTEKFREINLRLQTGAGSGWDSEMEYVAEVDASGNPARWERLNLIQDTTGNMTRSGKLVFDPPADWQAARINGGDFLYHVRFRTTGFGRAPITASILGRDYVNANGRHAGVIPAFDTTADRDGDGYLNDAEFANRKSGSDARFEYESRYFYPAYGQMRFATNMSSPAYRAWAADFSERHLEANPHADGLFVDNSLGRLALEGATIRESLANYAEDYGTAMSTINQRIAPKWVLANTAGGRQSVLPTVAHGVSYLEEFAIRPMRHNHVQFEDLAAQVKNRIDVSDGDSLAVLDSHPMGGSPTDPRTQLATLAYYYAIGDPDVTALMVNGGYEPNSSWTRHWIPAAAYDVGQPEGDYALFATGQDPSNKSLTYKIYEREYENALVLFKPLSYTRNNTGTTADRTGTTHDLTGVYRPLKADGTLGAAVTRITLRNGEGAVLIKVA